MGRVHVGRHADRPGPGRIVRGHRIAVLVPSRGRPENIERLYNVIQETAAEPHRVFLAVRVDEDDPARAGYQVLEQQLADAPGIGFEYGPRIRLAASWNEQAVWAAGTESRGFTHLAFWGDDVVPETQGWDLMFVRTLEDWGPGFAYGRDGVWDSNRWDEHPEHLVLPTAALCDVGTYRALGYVSPPGVLTHLCIDMVWRDVGMAAGALHYVPGVMLRHMHPIRGLAPYDITYAEANEGTQAARDHTAYPAWRNSDEFQAAVQRVGQYRDEVAALAKINRGTSE